MQGLDYSQVGWVGGWFSKCLIGAGGVRGRAGGWLGGRAGGWFGGGGRAGVQAGRWADGWAMIPRPTCCGVALLPYPTPSPPTMAAATMLCCATMLCSPLALECPASPGSPAPVSEPCRYSRLLRPHPPHPPTPLEHQEQKACPRAPSCPHTRIPQRTAPSLLLYLFNPFVACQSVNSYPPACLPVCMHLLFPLVAQAFPDMRGVPLLAA
jgi:hypothetical protein